MKCENGVCYLILPCPFCGGEAVINETWYDGPHKSIFCEKCQTSSYSYDTIEQAIEAWNKRTEDN